MAKVMKVRKKELPKKKIKLKLDDRRHTQKFANKVIDARRTAEINSKVATLKGVESLKPRRYAKAKTKWRDENDVEITPEQMERFQNEIAGFYRTYVVLTDEQIKLLADKLPKKVNNAPVQVGPKAVFPGILDGGRQKLSKERIVSKMNRLKYITTDDSRGLKLLPEDADKMFDKYKLQAQAKKDIVKTLIALSYNDFEICDFLEIKGHELARLKKEVFFEEIMTTRQMSNEERFAQYKLQQMEVVKDIDVLIERFKETKQLQALVGALKLKSDIQDGIISKGMEFGVIEKMPEKQAIIVGEIDITTATMGDLEDELAKTNKVIQKLVGTKTFLTAAKVIK